MVTACQRVKSAANAFRVRRSRLEDRDRDGARARLRAPRERERQLDERVGQVGQAGGDEALQRPVAAQRSDRGAAGQRRAAEAAREQHEHVRGRARRVAGREVEHDR
jgi:hypothetical protein